MNQIHDGIWKKFKSFAQKLDLVQANGKLEFKTFARLLRNIYVNKSVMLYLCLSSLFTFQGTFIHDL